MTIKTVNSNKNVFKLLYLIIILPLFLGAFNYKTEKIQQKLEQKDSVNNDNLYDSTIFEQPHFPGGDDACLKYISDIIKYPATASEQNIQGIVYVAFFVEKDGSITNVKVLRGIGGGCDEEAVRVIKSLPKWIPGKQRGQAVRAEFKIHIRFKLD